MSILLVKSEFTIYQCSTLNNEFTEFILNKAGKNEPSKLTILNWLQLVIIYHWIWSIVESYVPL